MSALSPKNVGTGLRVSPRALVEPLGRPYNDRPTAEVRPPAGLVGPLGRSYNDCPTAEVRPLGRLGGLIARLEKLNAAAIALEHSLAAEVSRIVGGGSDEVPQKHPTPTPSSELDVLEREIDALGTTLERIATDPAARLRSI